MTASQRPKTVLRSSLGLARICSVKVMMMMVMMDANMRQQAIQVGHAGLLSLLTSKPKRAPATGHESLQATSEAKI